MKEVCRETLQRVYLYLDGEILSVEERKEIEIHLEECAPCLERYGLDKEITQLLHRLRSNCQCPDGLRSRISNFLEA
jgi:mycothiol system anti-sigma-R factor